MISGHGNSDALIMLISDGASDGDIASGYALSGDREKKLKSFALANKLDWSQFWTTSLIKEKINLKKSEPNRVFLADPRWSQILLGEINEIKPNILVPLGELSFNFLTGLNGIRKFRGSILPPRGDIELYRPDLRVIPTLGPDPYLYEDQKLEFITRLDFSKIARNLHANGPIPEIGQIWFAQNAQQVRDFINRHYDNTLSSGGFLVFDIETFANLPTCVGFCFDGNESCCVPILDYKISIDERVSMLHSIIRLLASPIPKVNQNVKFDWRKLERLGIHVCNITGDTMLAQSVLYCEFPKNLGFLTSLYTDMPYFKDEGKDFAPGRSKREQLYLYNAKDCLSTHKIYTIQLEELAELGVHRVYNMLIQIMPIYRQMEENGILIDDTARQKLLAKYKFLFGLHSAKLKTLTGQDLNPLSAMMVAKLIYDELKWEVVSGVKHSKITGKPSADEESLEILMWSSRCNSTIGISILRTIIDCRKLHKCIEFLSLPTYPDGRHRCEFNLAGAETGRTTAGQTTDHYLYFDKGKIKLGDMGHSFQTIGKHGFEVSGVTYGQDLRSIFIPSPNHVFVECDLSQAEARVDAVLAKDFDILPVFDSATGIHRLTGSWIFNCPPSEIQKNTLVNGIDRYHVSKTVRHAAERNMTPKRLMMILGKPQDFCGQVLRTFHERQPNIRGIFHREIREQIQKHRCLISPNGRRRDFYGRIQEDTINEGISQLPQSIVTDYLKQSLPKTAEECKDFWRPLSEAHDGFLAEVPKGRELEYAQIYKRNIEQPINFRTCSLAREYDLTIPCETSISDTTWQDMKDVKL